ncbi:MAG: glycosyltransferase [Nitrospira sp.]|nr:glycosyltransferase [Nitrospira sp.]
MTDNIVTSNIAPKRRQKLLFLAYPFPPAKTPGCVRTWNIAMHMTRLGWDVTVVTPDPAILRNVEDEEKTSVELKQTGIKRILTAHRFRCLTPGNLKWWGWRLGRWAGGTCRIVARNLRVDKYVGWIKPSEQACSNLTADDVDLIFATGQPFVAFSLAKRLSDRLGRPYVLDYRDPWTGNPHAERPPWPGTIREEASLLEGCAAVSVVSPSWGLLLDRSFQIGTKLHILPNGYDSSEMAEVEPYDFGHCAFVYAGIFYPPKRVITPFLAALKLLKESLSEGDNEWYFHYYGVDENHVRREADRFGLSDRIVFHGGVPRRQALSAVKGARLAVVITSVADQETLEDKGIVTGKIFEAIGLETPVLLIAPVGSDARVITEPTGLVRSFAGTEIQGMVSFLKDVVRGWVPQAKNIEICSWTSISKNLDSLLRSVVVRNNCLTLLTASFGCTVLGV